MRGSRADIGDIRQWVVHRSTKRGFVRVRNFIKVGLLGVADASCSIQHPIKHHRGWISLARWNWLRHHGSIPPDSEVIHRRPPPDVPEAEFRTSYGPPDITVDDISNLILVAAGGVMGKIKLKPGGIRRHFERRRAGVTKSNEQRDRVAATLAIRPNAWYVVRTLENLIIMLPYRTKQRRAWRGNEPIECGENEIAVRGRDLFCEPYDGYRREVPGGEFSSGDEIPEDQDSLPLVEFRGVEFGDLERAA